MQRSPSTARLLAASVAVLVLEGAAASGLEAQQVPRDQYLRYVPLTYPRAVRQRPATRRLALYGERDAPDYRDEDPRDGIDDARGRRLQRLAVHFSPFLFRNTTAVPLDVRKLMQPPSAFPLHVATWDVSRPGGVLVESRSVELGAYRAASDDSVLTSLLAAFDPRDPGEARYGDATVSPDTELFRVLFVDFPGDGPEEWRREYRNAVSNRLPRQYSSFRKIYCHPFLRRVSGSGAATEGPRFEFVLQYWFFYPFNDGGNNHEGDWEHVNVIVTRRGAARASLGSSAVRRIFGGGGEAPLPLHRLRIARVEYYFHHKVMTVSYLDPDVLQDREAWRRDVEARSEERIGERWMWERTREMAYRTTAESTLNSHPVGYIGADNKGLDQLLSLPGGTNRDSHGTYPFPGLYKDIGPAAAAEQINAPLHPHRRLYDPSRRPDDRLERFDDPAKVEILPDWERVVDLVLEEPETRSSWWWLVLPLRWGYPAVKSPFAGVVPHAETGNLAPVGPAYNSAWNRVGAAGDYSAYAPHKFGGTLPLGWQDSFLNSWGFLNLTLPTLVNLPPFDVAWRLLAAPVRAPLQARHPTFFPKESVPFRMIGVSGGVSVSFLPDELSLLFTAPSLFDQIEPLLGTDADPGEVVDERTEAAVAPYLGIEFHLGRRLVSQSFIRHLGAEVALDVRGPGGTGVTPIRGDLEMWEYSGSLRYNFATGVVQPFVKAGYGLSWYRLRRARKAGTPLVPSATEWVRRPSVFPPENLLPNTWHVGLGLEAVPVRNFGGFPEGVDVAARLSYSVYAHGLGLRRPELLSEQEDVTVGRSHLNLGLSLSF